MEFESFYTASLREGVHDEPYLADFRTTRMADALARFYRMRGV